jgi:hypothetical protein
MKVTSFILFALLASHILAVKAGVKTITAASVWSKNASMQTGGADANAANVQIVGAEDNSKVDGLEVIAADGNPVADQPNIDTQLNIRSMMNDMVIDSEELEYSNLEETAFKDHVAVTNAYMESLGNLFEQLLAQEQPTVDCAPDAEDCLPAGVMKMILWSDNVTNNFYASKRTYFHIWFTPVCGKVELPTPYLENKVITVCLKAEATAKQVAEKAVRQAVSGVMTSRKAGQDQDKTCSHMKLDDNGNAVTTQTQCLDLDKGSNLVKCFFEISGSQTFMVDYQCFYPALWKTWFLSFKKVYLAMKAKGYVVNTPELQQRRCFLDEDLFYQGIQNDTSSAAYIAWSTKLAQKTEAQRQATCLMTFTEFCSNSPNPF